MNRGRNPELQECYNTARDTVHCDPDKDDCSTCGWNPEVAKARHKAMGIYPSVAELPTFGSFYGQILYVKQDQQIYPYTWKGNRWEWEPKAD